MLALGSCVAGVGILLAGLLVLLFRHPHAPRWTRPEIVAMLLCVPVTATIGVGLGYAAVGVTRLLHGAGDARELLVLIGVLLALALVWRGLRIRQRLRIYALATASIAPNVYQLVEPTLVIDETLPPPPSRPRTPRPTRSAA